MIGQEPQPTRAIINVRTSSDLQYLEFTNILTTILGSQRKFRLLIVGSQRKFRLLIMVGVFHGWDGERCETPRSLHPFLSRQVQIELVQPDRRRGRIRQPARRIGCCLTKSLARCRRGTKTVTHRMAGLDTSRRAEASEEGRVTWINVIPTFQRALPPRSPRS